MPNHQMIGLVLLGVAVLDTLLGHLVVAPRIADANKRAMLRMAFVSSSLLMAGLGFAFYKGIIGA